RTLPISRGAPGLLWDRKRRVGAFQKLDRHEHHVAVADILQIMHLEFAGPIRLMAGAAAGVAVFSRPAARHVAPPPAHARRGADNQMLPRGARRDGGPEIVEHVSMEAEPLSGLEADRPYPDLVGLRNQLAPHASIRAARFAGELLLQRSRPLGAVLSRGLLVG